ncbi:MAG: YfhO family protein, partial [Oscillospiraceae bacterium]|nr:YfhO family protein [Oscillospiraceae bacterium]
ELAVIDDGKLKEFGTHMELINKKGEYFELYKVKYNLPLAYCVYNDVEFWPYDNVPGGDSDFWKFRSNTDDYIAVHEDYIKRAAGVSGCFLPLDIESTDSKNNSAKNEYVTAGSYSYTKQNADQKASSTFEYTVEKSTNVYLTAKTNSKNLNVKINSDNLNIDYKMDRRYVCDLGYLDAGSVITLEVQIPEDAAATGSYYMYLYGLDGDAFEDAYNEIVANGTLDITSYSETDIEGTVRAAEDMLLYTSIPYDEGWQVFIDGERIPAAEYIKLANALLCVRIGAGEHSVRFKYEQRGLPEGILITIFTVASLLVYAVISRFFLKQRLFDALTLRNKKFRPVLERINKAPDNLYPVLKPGDDNNWDEA